MLGPAIDTLVVCTLTAMAILVTGVWQSTDVNGVSLTAAAFDQGIPYVGIMCCYYVSWRSASPHFSPILTTELNVYLS